MRILLADDHALMRAGIKASLQVYPDVEVVGEAGSGGQVIELAEQLKPDLIVMDINMPGKNGIEATREIKERHPEIRVLMVTSSDADDDVFAALESGATGYCVKSIDDDRLYAGIKAVCLGDLWLDETIAKVIARGVPHPSSRRSGQGDGGASVSASKSHDHDYDDLATLTAREIEVLRLLCDGLTNPEIAQKLFISKDTVKKTVSQILTKMQVSGRTEAAAAALRNRIV